MSVKRRYLDNIDFDPNNPYHYHSNNKKIVISKEDYKKYKNDPIFSDIKNTILKHQKDYPKPEYEEYENPEYKKVYSKIRGKAPINGVNAIAIEKGFSKYSPVPEGYYRDKHGVVFDNDGNIYRPHNGPADYHNKRSIAFNTNERNGQGTPYSLGWVKVDTPNKFIRKEKQPLPVDYIMNVEQERNKAIKDYIKNNTIPDRIEKAYTIPDFIYLGDEDVTSLYDRPKINKNYSIIKHTPKTAIDYDDIITGTTYVYNKEDAQKILNYYYNTQQAETLKTSDGRNIKDINNFHFIEEHNKLYKYPIKANKNNLFKAETYLDPNVSIKYKAQKPNKNQINKNARILIR